MKKIALTLALAALALLLTAPAANACTRPSPDAWLIIHSSTEAWLVFHRLVLIGDTASDVAVEEMDVCTAGLNLFPGVLEVTGASLVDSRTRKPLQSLQFQKSARATTLLETVSPQFGKGVPGLAPVTRWQGFVGKVKGSLRDGQLVDLMFDLKLDPNVPIERVIRAFNSQGAYTAGALTRRFTPVKDHFTVQRPHHIGVMFE